MQSFADGKGSANCMTMPKLNCSISRQLRRVMKITGIILLSTCLHLSAAGITQTVSLSETNAPFQKIIQLIERQTDYAFFYKVSWLNKANDVTINVVNMPVQQALNICFKNQPFTYIISGKNITIKPKEQEKTLVLFNIDVRGKIIDEEGRPMPGANIKLRGSNKGVISDSDGSFSLNDLDENAVLEISYVGFETAVIAVKGRKTLTISLTQKKSVLDETIVLAYGSTTRRFNTGNVSAVKAVDIEKQPVTNPLLALQGRVAGLYITQSTGLPGSGVTVRIQGQNSIRNGSDPLYVIDGVPYFSQFSSSVNGILGTSNRYGAASGSGNPLSFINPGDIETIEVLKDADATSIFGSRAANGAILITTKKGKPGKTKVDINIQNGWGKVTKKMDLLNTQQYLEMRRQALKNDGISSPSKTAYDINGHWDTTRYTDWQQALIGGTAQYSNIQTNVSGGNLNTQFLLGLGYNIQTTVFPGNLADKKGTVHFNVNHRSDNKKFELQFSGSYQSDVNKLINRDLTSDALFLPPNAPEIHAEDGTLNWAPTLSGTSSWVNPLAYLQQKYQINTSNLISNANVSYKILSGLEIKSSFGFNSFQSDEVSTTPLSSLTPEERLSSSSSSFFGDSKLRTWIIEPQLLYKRKFLGGIFDLIVGSSFQQSKSNSQRTYGSGYSSDHLIEDVRSASFLFILATSSSIYKYNALFGRANYIWKEKYVVNLNARRDGSSRFGADNQFHNFASLGGAWIFSKEKVFEKSLPFISFGKVSGSYGTTGSDQIGDYSFMALYSPLGARPYQGIVGLTANNLTNPYLQWEETKKLQVSLDLGFFKDRLITKATYFKNRSSNQLLGYTLPVITGFGGITTNFPATVENTGLELSLNSTNIATKLFKWSTSCNFTTLRNKLISFPNLSSSGYASTLVVGKPITVLRTYRFHGVNPNTGLYEYESGDTLTSAPSFATHATNRVNTSPLFYGGFENSFQYRGFQFDFLFQFAKQRGKSYFYGNTPGQYFPGSNFGNQPTSVLASWKKQGDESPIQKLSSTYPTAIRRAFNPIQSSDAAWGDASYVRLKNVSLTWQFPAKLIERLRLSKADLFVLGQNLLTITDYYGLDPETGSDVLPPLKIVSLGIRLVL